ncbi:swift like BRCT domain-containing protein [Cryptosporidium canis]|nr:swift like BRCT domain-containing protein [Cryptosporidium canis]
MYIRSEHEEEVKNGEEIDEVGCLLIFDEMYNTVVDSFPLMEGRNYICGSTRSVFEPQEERSKKRAKNVKSKSSSRVENEDCHAVVHVEHGEFFVEDMNSEVGTFRRNLISKIRPNCKYEIIPGDDLYFGNLKTKLIKYDSIETIETPRWSRSAFKNQQNDEMHVEIEEQSLISHEAVESERGNEDEKENEKRGRSLENETISTFNDDIENDSLLSNRPKRRSPKSLSEKTAVGPKKGIVLLWTGCAPTNKDIELIRKASITSIDSEDLELMSDQVTHVVASSIKRTLKFLWAISKGLPIISPTTLRQILNSNKSKDLSYSEFNELCMSQLLYDSEGEKKFAFSLQSSIKKSQKRGCPIFNNYKFVISPNVKVPSTGEVTWLLKSSGAQIIELESTHKIQDKSKLIFIGTSMDNCKLFK